MRSKEWSWGDLSSHPSSATSQWVVLGWLLGLSWPRFLHLQTLRESKDHGGPAGK